MGGVKLVLLSALYGANSNEFVASWSICVGKSRKGGKYLLY